MLYALCFLSSHAINEEVHSLWVEHACDTNAQCNLLTAHKVFISSALLHWPRRFCHRWDQRQHQPPARRRKLSCAFHSLCTPALAFVIVAQTVGWCLALPELFSKSWSVVSLRWRAVVDAQCSVSERWRICSVQCGCTLQRAWTRERTCGLFGTVNFVVVSAVVIIQHLLDRLGLIRVDLCPPVVIWMPSGLYWRRL